MTSTATTIETIVEAPVERAFEHIVPIDLTSMFTGYGPLPAITGSREQTGNWDGAGQSRLVVFSDGSTARETLTGHERPGHFTYRITEFTGALQPLIREARGAWWFERVPGRAATRVRWRYEFVPRNIWLTPLVALFTRTLWRGYMRKALGLATQQVEGRHAA